MNWLARLKNEKAPGTHATKATKPGFVGFVAPASGASQKVECEAQTRPTPELPAPDPRLSWSHYTPANAAEIVRMAARVERAEALGLSEREADLAVDRLLRRDREGLRDMHLCLECARLRADATGWRCGALRGPIPREWVATQLQRCPTFKGGEP
jgi:hypothetical protein